MIIQEVVIECDACKEQRGTLMRNGAVDVPPGWVFDDHYEAVDKQRVVNAVSSLVSMSKHFCSETCRAAVTASPEVEHPGDYVRVGGTAERLETGRIARCSTCGNKGFVETGGNDLPCEKCVRGRDIVFYGGQTGEQTLLSYNGYTPARWPVAWGPSKCRHGILMTAACTYCARVSQATIDNARALEKHRDDNLCTCMVDPHGCVAHN